MIRLKGDADGWPLMVKGHHRLYGRDFSLSPHRLRRGHNKRRNPRQLISCDSMINGPDMSRICFVGEIDRIAGSWSVRRLMRYA